MTTTASKVTSRPYSTVAAPLSAVRAERARRRSAMTLRFGTSWLPEKGGQVAIRYRMGPGRPDLFRGCKLVVLGPAQPPVAHERHRTPVHTALGHQVPAQRLDDRGLAGQPGIEPADICDRLRNLPEDIVVDIHVLEFDLPALRCAALRCAALRCAALRSVRLRNARRRSPAEQPLGPAEQPLGRRAHGRDEPLTVGGAVPGEPGDAYPIGLVNFQLVAG